MKEGQRWMCDFSEEGQITPIPYKKIIMNHISVLKNEVIDILAPKENGVYLDATVGLAGHTKEIFKKTNGKAKVVCVDQNSKSLEKAKENLSGYSENCEFVNANFSELKDILSKLKIEKIDGIIYDLGFASWQVDDGGLGLSFQKDEKLDMRLKGFNYDKKELTARELINKFSVKKIADILYKYGDVRNSWAIARRIDISRREKNIETTFDLVMAIGTKSPKVLAPIFQAFRIYVNNEFENLEKTLLDVKDFISRDGKIVVISFHSGEDRIVKNIFKKIKKEDGFEILTKKPIMANREELKTNSRSRSAKLRAVRKI